MTLLLDAHAFLWFCQNDSALTASARSLIEDPGNRKFVSVASCWEIAIKAGLKKLVPGEPSSTYLSAALLRTGFDLLSITLEHATVVETLPAHHKDAFDRLLIAQAMIEAIPVVSIDDKFDAYPVTRLW
jgi:PIN domain nuclease of toxin-antitoxin system